MKYNDGDKVLIKNIDWYNANKDENGDVVIDNDNPYAIDDFVFTKWDAVMCGKIMTIDYRNSEGYWMIEDEGDRLWCDEMIEKLVEQNPIFKIGDKVVCFNGCPGVVEKIYRQNDGLVKYGVSFGNGIDYGCYMQHHLKPDDYKPKRKKEPEIPILQDRYEIFIPNDYEAFIEDGKVIFQRKNE